MEQLNIMSSLKHIFITGGLSFMLGIYSLYNIVNYFKYIKNQYNKEVEALKEIIIKNNRNYELLKNQYDILDNKYIKIKQILEKTNNEMMILNQKIVLIEGRIENHTSCFLESDDIISETSFYKPDSILCDDLCELNNSMPRVHYDTTSSNDDIVKINYNYITEIDNTDDNEDDKYKKKENNWLSKKLFG